MENQILNTIAKVTKINAEELVVRKTEEKLWDSLIHVELVITLESEFNIFFESEEIAEMVSVAKILEMVERKVQ